MKRLVTFEILVRDEETEHWLNNSIFDLFNSVSMTEAMVLRSDSEKASKADIKIGRAELESNAYDSEEIKDWLAF